MPLNLPSHAHGEGYSDMNAVIPELVQRVNYEKGPYYANVGNYGSAGAAHLEFFKTLPQDFITLEGGMFGFERGVFGASQTVGSGSLLLGGEAYHDDGPWTHADDYNKFNGLLTYSQGSDANGFSATARAYHGKWNSSDQIAENAVPLVGTFGTLNPTDGGNSQRYSLQGEWHRQDENSATKITAHAFYYDLDLCSDFCDFLTDVTLGDRFEQQDRRWVAGVEAHHTLYSQWFGRDVENTFGLQIRNDWINNGLFQTSDRMRVDKLDSDTGTILPATSQAERARFTDTEAGAYFQNKIQWAEKFRSEVGLRGDIEYFDVTSLSDPANSGASTTLLLQPQAQFGFWSRGRRRNSMPRADSVFTGNDGRWRSHADDGAGFRRTIQPRHPGLPNSRPDPDQRRGNRRPDRCRAASPKRAFALVSAQ